MAEIKVPNNVVRLKPKENPYTTWGYKWHLVKRPDRKKRGAKTSHTSCGILMKSFFNIWESKKLSDVSKRDLCSRCFSGLIIN